MKAVYLLFLIVFLIIVEVNVSIYLFNVVNPWLGIGLGIIGTILLLIWFLKTITKTKY